MKQYILAIDQGTTSTRAILFNKLGEIVHSSQKEISIIYPQEGYVLQNPYDIWSSVLQTMADCLLQAEVDPSEIASIGITNQRETTILWNRKTHRPVYDAIVWQSKQSSEICDDLKAKNMTDFVHQKTGLLIDPYFSATKIKWVLDNVKGVSELMSSGDLQFGTVDSWLLYKLTGNIEHKTDVTNASRTLLYNIIDKQWDQELLDLFGIASSVLPEVCESNALFGMTNETTFFGQKVPITGILGDQQAALFGQTCFSEGSIKNTYGTGCFMLMNTGNEPVFSDKGLLTTIAYSINGTPTYALEGSVFVAGSAIQWLRDELMFFSKASDSELLATQVSTTNVVVVPAFVGLGTPYWDSKVRGAIFGLTRSTSKQEITRATLEALAYQTKDIIDVMTQESNITPTILKVDGGASLNNFLMQFQADILNIDITRPNINETTALGAAYMSGLGSGMYQNMEEIKQIHSNNHIYTPKMNQSKRENLYNRWLKAIDAARSFQ